MHARIHRTSTFIFIYVYIHSIRLVHSSTYMETIHPEENCMLLFISQFLVFKLLYALHDCIWMASHAFNYSHLDDENSILNTWRPIKCSVFYFWMLSLLPPTPLTSKMTMITIITIWRVLLIPYKQHISSVGYMCAVYQVFYTLKELLNWNWRSRFVTSAATAITIATATSSEA